MKPSEKFVKRLREEFKVDIPDDYKVVSTHAGIHQRNAGALTSFFFSPSKMQFNIGLYRSIVKLLKCPNLVYYKEFYGQWVVECNCINGRCKGYLKKDKL